MTEEELRNSEVLSAYHNAYIGHHGAKATVKMLQSEGHYWTDMIEDVRKYIAACPTCQKVRLGQGSVEASMTIRASREPFQELEIDFIGPLQPDEDGNTFILVVVCCFTRVCELFPCKGATSKDTARSLLSVFSRYGLCTILRSDNGSHFANHIVNDLLSLLNVEHRCGIPYRPQIQGIVERLNQEVMRHLRAIIYDCRVVKQWSMYLPFVQRIINNTYHSSIGTRPNRLLFGDNITINRNLLVPVPKQNAITLEDYVQELNTQLINIVAASKRHQDTLAITHEEKQPANPTIFVEGQYVLAKWPKGAPHKHMHKWRGPLVVVETNGNLVKCQDLITQEVSDYHVAML